MKTAQTVILLVAISKHINSSGTLFVKKKNYCKKNKTFIKIKKKIVKNYCYPNAIKV